MKRPNSVLAAGTLCLCLWAGFAMRANASENAAMGVGKSWSEEEGSPRSPEYQLKPEFVEALRLTKEQEQALLSYMPEFRPWNIGDYPEVVRKQYPHSMAQLSYTVSGDFDGNGRRDIAIAGRTNSANIILALMSDTSGYHVLPILSSVRDPGQPELDVLFLIKKGTRFAIDGESEPGAEEVMAHDGIQPATIGAASSAFGGRRDAKRLVRYAEGLKNVRPMAVEPEKTSTFKPEYQKELQPTPAMKKAIAAYDKNFKMWQIRDYPEKAIKDYPYSEKALPYAVKGDLNDDGKIDMVVAGHNSNGNVILVLLSDGAGYKVQGGGAQCYKEAAKRGKKLPYMPSEVLRIYGKGSRIYDSYNMPVTVNGNIYGYQTIYSCGGPDEAVANDWTEVSAQPEYSAYVKTFEQVHYHSLRIIEPLSARSKS